jgi:hypothetical protein
MKIIFVLIFTLTFTGCVQNVGGKYSLFIEANQKVFDFSTPADYTYTGAEVEVSSNQATIQTNYTVTDDFADNDYTGIWTPEVVNGVSATYVETSESMNYDCQLGIMAMDRTPPLVLTDHIVYVETTPTAFDIGQKPLTIIGRYVDSSNFYIGITDNINHYIYKMIGGFMTAIATIPTTISQSTGTTYAQKLKLDATTISYKIWELGTPEPVGWNTTANDANIASGSFALSCYSGNGIWDNARVYEVAATTDYDLTNPAIEFPEFIISDNLSRYESISIDATLSGSDTIKFDVSYDGGATFLTYTGGNWQLNGSGYSGAMTVTEVNLHLKTFATETSAITFRAYLHSNDGTTTPTFNGLTLSYSTQMQ